MSSKSLFLILGVAAVAYYGYERQQKKEALTATGLPAGVQPATPTYVVMEKGGPVFRVSADTRARIDQWSTEKVVLFGASWCTYCAHERKVFKEKGIRFFEVDVDRDPAAMKFMVEVLGVPAVPATVFGTRLLPGFNAQEFDEIVRSL